ncbi:MAG TPA: DUF5671 domain-containing protein [Acidimicrobiia bacterium]|jgi:hypothetical protein|nr:DUF5671 domain-containing protein [Acidimicrobiia bacterium]
MYGLVNLVILGAIVYAIVLAVKRRGTDRDPVESGGLEVGRVFRYLLTIIALIVAAIGVTELLGMALASADARRGSVAEPLAMTIVAVPAFAVLARWGWRKLHDDPSERDAPGWSLYLNGALTVTLAVTVGNGIAVADRLVNGEWRGFAIAGLAVWGAAWAGHWWVWRAQRPGIWPNGPLWTGSIIGLWTGAISAGVAVNLGVQEIFDAASDVLVVTDDDRTLATAAIGAGIGAAVWFWHWLRHGWRAMRTAGWYVYVLLFGVFAGLAAAVAGGGYGLYLVLEWVWGEPSASSAVVHFRHLATPIAAAGIGGGVWWYHRSVVGPTSAKPRTEIHRTYEYLVAGVALATVAVALVILVMAIFPALTPASAASDDASTNTLLAAITLLAVGAPMWTITWLRIQRTCAGNDAEIGAPSRRRYLFAIFGLSGMTAFGSLISLLIVVFQALLGERSGGPLASDLDVPVALLLTTGVIAAYHWLVYRSERSVAVHLPKRDVLLVCDGVRTVDEIAERTHSKVRVLHRLDVVGGRAADVEGIIAAIEHTDGEHILVVAGPDEIEAFPFE